MLGGAFGNGAPPFTFLATFRMPGRQLDTNQMKPNCSSILAMLLALSSVTTISAQQPRPAAPQSASGPAVEGRDYLAVKRIRFLDNNGFERPVEAFSMLFPRAWNVQGGVRWGSLAGCRGEIVANIVKAASPDGSIRMEVFPIRSFNFSNNPQMMQLLQTGAQSGGCRVNAPFDVSRFIEGFARMELGGQASNIRIDNGRQPGMQQIDQQANNVARQYGNNSQQTTGIAYGDVKWPDGSEGIIHAVASTVISSQANVMMATTTIPHCILVRFPAGRREEGSKLLEMAMASHRVNPIWQEAKTQYLNTVGNREHGERMERIRLEGERARAYFEAQNAASDRRMRDWERQQNSQDRQHREFIQTIREVETWRDSSGSGVELSAGYSQAWSRGDGQYILSNKPGFDPRSVFQDQGWSPMVRSRP